MTHFYVWMALLRAGLCQIIVDDDVTALMNECQEEFYQLFERGFPVDAVYSLIDHETRDL